MTHKYRFAIALMVMSTCCWLGCGSSNSPVAENEPGPQASDSQPTEVKIDTSPAMNVVSQFLDSVRRGGTDTEAIALVTTKAREEFQRTGRVLQPIGSPNAKFEVTRSEPLPEQEGAAFVHSRWTEPNEDGEVETSEVVWAVQQEEGQWRISGMVIGHATKGRPIVVDFENGDSLARMFQPKDAEGSGSVLQATLPSEAAQGGSILQATLPSEAEQGGSVLQATLPPDAGLPVDAGESVLR